MTPNVNRTLPMNENEKLAEWIVRFNNHDLHGEELKEFMDMMKQDPELRREINLDKDLNEILTETEIIELRKKLLKFRPPKETFNLGLHIFILAASVTLLIGLAFFVYLWRNQGNDAIMNTGNAFNPSDTSIYSNYPLSHKEQVKPDDSTSDSLKDLMIQKGRNGANKTLLADNYKPYPPYESMVGEVSRTGNFKLINPSSSASFRKGNVISFIWETDDSHSLIIKMTDNKGELRFVSGSIDGKSFLFDTSKLAEGLYYVKFIYNDEIVCFIKFTLH
jgi:hypothetical protein